jgi:hypothetical protein
LGVDCCRVGSGEGGWAAAADAEELNLRHDESVAATVLAHNAVEVRKTLKVEDLLGRRLAAHAGVPLVVALDETDNTASAVAEESLLVVGRVVGDELWLLALTGDGLDGAHDHVRVSLSNLERSIDLVGVVVCANVLERGLVLRLQVLAARLRKVVCWDGHLKKGKHRRDRLDGGDVKVFPAAEVANVPPEVVVDATWCASDSANQRRGGVGRGEVLNQRRRSRDLLEAVEAEISEGRVLHSWCGLKLWDSKVLRASGREAGHILDRRVGGREGSDEAQVGLGCT